MGELDGSGLTRDQQRSLRFVAIGWYSADLLIAAMALGMVLRGTKIVGIVLFVYVVASLPLGLWLIRNRRKQLRTANIGTASRPPLH